MLPHRVTPKRFRVNALITNKSELTLNVVRKHEKVVDVIKEEIVGFFKSRVSEEETRSGHSGRGFILRGRDYN